MTDDFAVFHESLLDLIKSFEKKNTLVKIHSDPNSNIVRIYGEKSTTLELAKVGLEEVEELALTTAEHHPYWSLLYDGSQMLKIVLEKWNDNLAENEIKEILWYVDKIKNALSNITENHRHE